VKATCYGGPHDGLVITRTRLRREIRFSLGPYVDKRWVEHAVYELVDGRYDFVCIEPAVGRRRRSRA
jgi:hypothetical protein